MKLHRLPRFDRDYKKLPVGIKTKLYRQLKVISDNLQHPGLHVKKIKGQTDVWEARVDKFYRLYKILIFEFPPDFFIVFLLPIDDFQKQIINFFRSKRISSSLARNTFFLRKFIHVVAKRKSDILVLKFLSPLS